MPDQYTQPTLIATEKRCAKCAAVKPLAAFYASKQTRDGLFPYCRQCISDMKRKPKPSEVPGHRTCRLCKQSKPLSEYSIDSLRGKPFARCKTCQAAKANEWYYANHERAAERGRQYRQNNRDKIDARVQTWVASHPERHAENQRRWRERNQDRLRDYRRIHLSSNADGRAKTVKRYLQAHHEEVQARARFRRAVKRGGTGTLTAAEWREIVEYFNGHCAYCNQIPDRLTQDHIIPVSKGGTHTKDNVVPACQSCNSRKHDRPLWRFLMIQRR